MASAVNLRKGMAVVFNGGVCIVTEFQHSTPGNKRAIVQTTMRNIQTGASFQQRFRPGDEIELARLESKKMQYLYSDSDFCHFMDVEDYHQISMSLQDVGGAINFLSENMEVSLVVYQEKPIQVDLPASICSKVIETVPGVKGDSVTNIMKPATLETGLQLQVPLFINEGDIIKVDTRTGEYLGRG